MSDEYAPFQPFYELGAVQEQPNGSLLRRITATKNLRQFGVMAGDEGGLIASENNLPWMYAATPSWADYSSKIRDTATVHSSVLIQNSDIAGHGWVSNDSRLYRVKAVGNYHISSTEIYDSKVQDIFIPYSHFSIEGADFRNAQHIIQAGPIGSENVMVQMHRTEGGGHELKVGCWGGQVGELLDEVERRASRYWHQGSDAQRKQWWAEYKALHAMLHVRALRWKAGY